MIIQRLFPSTISAYLARLYALSFVQLLGILLGIVYLFETVELLRRAAKLDDFPFALVLQMGLYKLPEVGQIILPFGILFAALYTFWSLVRRHELVIVRAAGMSVWQFLGPIVGVAMLIGVIHMTIINPVGALLISKYHEMEKNYLEQQDSTVSIGDQGLWLRQTVKQGGVLLHADKVKMPDWTLQGVTVFYFQKDGAFEKRLDAPSAVLMDKKWVFSNPIINNGGVPQHLDQDTLATDLTTTKIEEGFSTAEETPFWALPAYIQTMESAGFDSRKLKSHFHSLLAQPLLFAAMVFLAATVSIRSSRSHPTGRMIAAGAAIGFLMFFANSFLQALGASDQIPVLVAAWFPPIIALILGGSVILTTEDG